MYSSYNNARPRIAFAHLAKPPQQPTASFIGNYKEINFETLKERHDNFSFQKAIDCQH
jgi:hypothetical protein